MKNIVKILGILFFVATVFTSCSTEDFDQSETLIVEAEIKSMDIDESNSTARISSTQWNVQSACVSSGNFTTDIPWRYKHTNSYIILNVLGSDKDINCGTSGNPRTELRGLKEFTLGDSKRHAMYVTMKIEKLNAGSKRVIIGQIFDKNGKGPGRGDDYGTIYIKNNKLYGIFDGGSAKVLDSSVNEGDTIKFYIRSENGTTKLARNGGSSLTETTSNSTTCYFKTGSYLISKTSSHRAQVKITSLSQS